MTVRRIALLGGWIAFAAAGCGRDRAPSTGGAAIDGAGADSAATAGPLALLLDVPTTVRAGDEVTIAVTLVNRGAAAASFGAVQPDVVVTRQDGAELWRRSRHEPAASGAATSLRPNEMRGSGYAWDQRDDAGQPVAPGIYRIRAEAPALKLASERRTITIQP